MKTLKQKLAAMPQGRRARIAARADELEAEEMSLQALRQARKLTQERMAKILGIAQESVSRLEKRKDVLLSTLNQYVEAMGGQLCVTVDFPDRPSVRLLDLQATSYPRRHSLRKPASQKRAAGAK